MPKLYIPKIKKEPTKLEHKFCTKCDIEQPFDAFKEYKQGRFGLHSWCNACLSQYGKRNNKKPTAKAGYKICLKCEIEFLANKDNFHLSTRSKDGLSPRCKNCTNSYYSTKPKVSRKEYVRQYRATHREEMNARERNRLKDPKNRAIKNIGQWTRQFLKSHKCKYSKTIGCTREELVKHLESQFTSGMSWNNYGGGPGKWQIDHIKSLALSILEGPESFSQACNYKNLQPLWYEDHVKKSKNDLFLIKVMKSKL